MNCAASMSWPQSWCLASPWIKQKGWARRFEMRYCGVVSLLPLLRAGCLACLVTGGCFVEGHTLSGAKQGWSWGLSGASQKISVQGIWQWCWSLSRLVQALQAPAFSREGLEGVNGKGDWRGGSLAVTPRCPVSDDLKFGRDCQLVERGFVLQLLFWAGVQNHLSASRWVSSCPVGLTCAVQACWKSTSQ